MNYKYYGRFIISDFTSSEFNDAMGALSRAYPDDQKRYELVPLSTRLALYEVSPTFAKLQAKKESQQNAAQAALKKIKNDASFKEQIEATKAQNHLQT